MAILGLALEAWLVLVLAGAAGGAFGAAIGALPALSLSGFLVLVGSVTGGDMGAGSAVSAIGMPVPTGLGPVFGPHVAFAGGVAAAAYAARRGYMDTEFEYFEAKNIARPLGPKPDVMAIGAAFGVLGVLFRQVVGEIGLPLDPIFLTVLLSGLVARLTLGFPLVGTPRRDRGRFDMTQFNQREVDTAAMGGEVLSGGGERATHGDRLPVEPWLPHQYQWATVTAIGVVGGIIGGYLALASGSVFLAFGVSAASLVFLAMGLWDVPVTHHVTLPASLATLAFVAGGGSSMPVALVVGTVFGVGSALVAEGAQRLLYAHADTHVDPAATGIVVTTLVLGILIEADVLGKVALL